MMSSMPWRSSVPGRDAAQRGDQRGVPAVIGSPVTCSYCTPHDRPAPLLVVDGDSLMHRAYHAMPP